MLLLTSQSATFVLQTNFELLSVPGQFLVPHYIVQNFCYISEMLSLWFEVFLYVVMAVVV